MLLSALSINRTFFFFFLTCQHVANQIADGVGENGQSQDFQLEGGSGLSP